jgi:hypothetical protein
LPGSVKTIPLVVSQKRGFFIMAVVIVLVSNIVMTLVSVSQQYVAQSSFSRAQANSESVEEFELVAADAYVLYQDDRFPSIRAQIKLANLTKAD